jgi:hypothetical protein
MTNTRYIYAPIQEPWRPSHLPEACETNPWSHSRADWACSQAIWPIPLTAMQRRIYDFVRYYQRMWGESPLYREIREACGLKSDSSVQYQIRQLVGVGLIRKPARRVRAIILTAVPVALS